MVIRHRIWIFLHVMGIFWQQVEGKHIPIHNHYDRPNVTGILSDTIINDAPRNHSAKMNEYTTTICNNIFGKETGNLMKIP